MNVCILGLGYVGLTLALSFADSGVKVFGVDNNKKIISSLKTGKSTISEKNIISLLSKHIGKNFEVSEKIPDINIDNFVISVGTPLDENNSPIMDYVIKSTETIASKLKSNHLVILRSTVPVGTARNSVIPLLEEISGLKAGRDFEVVFAPERSAEGVAISEMKKNPQIIGGISDKGVKQASDLFKKLTPSIVTVSNLETAEMIKLIDNSYRDVHFAYSNEIALLCEMLHIDAKECIDKANFQYPRNSIPTPSPGVGGPCITKDPLILVHVAKKFGYKLNLITHSRWLNEYVPSHLASKVIKKIETAGKKINKAKIFVIGFAYKGNPETADTRHSSTLILVRELKKQISAIYGYDPVVTTQELESIGVIPTTLEEGFKNADCVVIMNNHKSYLSLNMKNLINKTSKPCVFVDCWSMFENIAEEKDVIYTGVGID